jgi:hypothetical protein
MYTTSRIIDPRQIGERILGRIDWQTEVSGFCKCPTEEGGDCVGPDSAHGGVLLREVRPLEPVGKEVALVGRFLVVCDSQRGGHSEDCEERDQAAIRLYLEDPQKTLKEAKDGYNFGFESVKMRLSGVLL